MPVATVIVTETPQGPEVTLYPGTVNENNEVITKGRFVQLEIVNVSDEVDRILRAGRDLGGLEQQLFQLGRLYETPHRT